MTTDRSEGWDAFADQYIGLRDQTDFGAAAVRSWARENLPKSSTIVDVGCGSGVPITQTLIEEGFTLFAIDASPNMLATFRRRFPDVPTACEAAQDSVFFDRTFDAAVSVGLLFLLSADDQRKALSGMANAVRQGGRLLFTAPWQVCEWDDLLTGRRSRSLGEQEYGRLLESSGLQIVDRFTDEGENNYYDAIKRVATL